MVARVKRGRKRQGSPLHRCKECGGGLGRYAVVPGRGGVVVPKDPWLNRPLSRPRPPCRLELEWFEERPYVRVLCRRERCKRNERITAEDYGQSRGAMERRGPVIYV